MALNWADRLLLASPAREMKALADADHKIYTERIWWRTRIRYVAQRRRRYGCSSVPGHRGLHERIAGCAGIGRSRDGYVMAGSAGLHVPAPAKRR